MEARTQQPATRHCTQQMQLKEHKLKRETYELKGHTLISINRLKLEVEPKEQDD